MKNKRKNPKYPSIKIGESYVDKLGLPRYDWSDIYHLLLTLSWPRFLALASGFFVLTNAVFALAYLVQDNGIENARPHSFADAFFFSVETIATVGYGAMHPATLYTHIVSTVEILVGMLAVSMMTGMMFARFSRPTARVLFSDSATEHGPYEPSIKQAYTVEVRQLDGSAQKEMPKDLCYATVRKTRWGGRVINIAKTLVFGTLSVLMMLIFRSTISNTINTSFVERR